MFAFILQATPAGDGDETAFRPAETAFHPAETRDDSGSKNPLDLRVAPPHMGYLPPHNVSACVEMIPTARGSILHPPRASQVSYTACFFKRII